MERSDVEVGRPFAVRLDADIEGDAPLVERGRLRRRDPRGPFERLAPVRQNEALPLDAVAILALLPQRVLDLEQVREVTPRVDPDLQVDRCIVVVQDPQLLDEPLRDDPLSDHREARVDIHRFEARDEDYRPARQRVYRSPKWASGVVVPVRK